jgi:hypothetical protein
MRRPTGNYLVWFTIRYHCHLLIKLWQCRLALSSPHPRVEEFQNKFAKPHWRVEAKRLLLHVF